MSSETVIRPTKKQKQLLDFIETFIDQHGYSPSYREVMHGLNYNSVATVALHINNLIRRGHLQKRDHSARSLELSHPSNPSAADDKIVTKQLNTSEAKWLIGKIETFFKDVETASNVGEREIDKLYVLIGALKVLGQDGAASAYIARLSDIKKRRAKHEFSV